MCAFTHLRMSPHLFHPENWRKFVAFVKKMMEGVSIYYIVNIYCRPSLYYRLIVGLLGFRPNLLVLHILSIYRQLHVLNIILNIITLSLFC